MIGIDDIEVMLSPEFRRALEENLERDPAAVAMDKRLAHASLLATQVKYLQRARSKLPSYYAARCIVPPLAFEQSSSEEAARLKEGGWGLCIDLTCGLGVDSFALSKTAGRVIAIERDPVLAAVARVNFRLLGAGNIEVVECAAEEFVGTYRGEKASVVYADPDRRGSGGEKLVRLEDCSPDVVALAPRLREMADRLVVKCSPMFDVGEAFRLFCDRVRVEAVSLRGECKEVLIEVSDDIAQPVVAATAIGKGSVEYPARRPAAGPGRVDFEEVAGAAYLVVPDVALQKARVAVDYFGGLGMKISSDNGYAYALAGTLPEGILGRVARIERVAEYKPRELRRELKSRGIRNIEILKRNFPQEPAEIARRLGVGQGGGAAVAFTSEGGRRIVIFASFITFA